ncbi:MAG: hypothetical protein IKE58_08230 [Blautia sp.]|nr:hypothetical protein [Blautia sp.]
MYGLLYLICCFLAGDRLVRYLLPKSVHGGRVSLGVRLAAAFGVGTLLLTWAVYGLAYYFSARPLTGQPLRLANLLVIGTVLAWMAVSFILCRGKRRSWMEWSRFEKPRVRELFFILLLLVFASFIMFYVFHVKDHVLCSGYTVFSDYAPHTAMIRSFSRENNYPTQYPHFGGADIRYHFMFQFLAGNLEYLGMRIDFAYNIPSILALVGFWIMLCEICRRVGAGFLGTVLTVLFFLFRSGTAFPQYLWEHFQAGDLGQALHDNTSFIGYTTNENWGLWNFNVYLNQRHLAFGLLLGAFVIWLYLEWLDQENSVFFLSPRAFTCIHPEKALAAGAILGLLSFWNGATVIGCLLILFGFAVFSQGKLDYLITAITAILLTLLQSNFFVNGSLISFQVFFGFLADQKTIMGVLVYLMKISGFFFLGAIVLLAALEKKERIIAFAFLLPLFFAFCFSLTPDIAVNQKYIMISYAFLAVFWGWAVSALFRRGLFNRLLALVLTVTLCATGVYDFVIIIRDNDSQHCLRVDLDSRTTAWLNENLDEKDLILSPLYSMSDVTLSGNMLYLGWPYYPWSAGYDTDSRSKRQQLMYTTEESELLRRICTEEGITYIIFEEGMKLDSIPCREDTIRRTYPLVFENEQGSLRIYRCEGAHG